MSDRLKQIWSSFEGQTSRNLTGNGIHNIHVPHRREWRTSDDQFIPNEYEAPAERAFAALSYKLSIDEARYGKKGKIKSYKQNKAYSSHYKGKQPKAEQRGEAQSHGRSYDASSDPRQTLLASLRETDFRVLRHEINYTLNGAERTEEVLKRRTRKKFLGIF